MQQPENATPSDADFTNALIRKFMRLSNGSVVVLYNTSLDYDDEWSPERRNADRLWVCIFIGVFLSVCAVISLLVLLYVFCTQRTSLWPFYRAGASASGQPTDEDKDKELYMRSPEAAAEEGRAMPTAEQEGLLGATGEQSEPSLQQQQHQPASHPPPAAITASTSSSSDSEPEAGPPKAP